MTEWLKVAVLKTAVPQGTGGSNPSSSVFLHRCQFDGGAFFVSYWAIEVFWALGLFFRKCFDAGFGLAYIGAIIRSDGQTGEESLWIAAKLLVKV